MLPWFIENPFLNANNVDPDKTPRSAASDLGLYCLPMSLLWDARHKWVNYICILSFDIDVVCEQTLNKYNLT